MGVLLGVAVTGGRAAAGEGQESAGKLRARGDSAFFSGNMQEALKYFTAAIRAEPGNAENYYKRYRVHLRQQNNRKAIADINAAVRAREDDHHVRALSQPHNAPCARVV